MVYSKSKIPNSNSETQFGVNLKTIFSKTYFKMSLNFTVTRQFIDNDLSARLCVIWSH